MAIHQWRRLLPSSLRLTRHVSSSSSNRRRRVVVTGLGMVTPLGCGVETTWKRLIEGECGVRAISSKDLKLDGFDAETQAHVFDQLTSKVAAIVPSGTNAGEYNEQMWLNSQERSISRFIAYALCAADEALRDANWVATEQDQKERTMTREYLLVVVLEAYLI